MAEYMQIRDQIMSLFNEALDPLSTAEGFEKHITGHETVTDVTYSLGPDIELRCSITDDDVDEAIFWYRAEGDEWVSILYVMDTAQNARWLGFVNQLLVW